MTTGTWFKFSPFYSFTAPNIKIAACVPFCPSVSRLSTQHSAAGSSKASSSFAFRISVRSCPASRSMLLGCLRITRAPLHRSIAAFNKLCVMRSGPSKSPSFRGFFNRTSGSISATSGSSFNIWSFSKHFIVTPFVYASIYSASTAALSLALFSATQLAAAPAFAKGIALLASGGTAFGVGWGHGFINGTHRLFIQERALVQLFPLGQIFDFLKSKDTKPLDMEVSHIPLVFAAARSHSYIIQESKAVAAKIKSALLESQFIPGILRPIAAYAVEMILPVSTICAIPETIEQVTPFLVTAHKSPRPFSHHRALPR
jgi:hypothetical protein